MSVPSVRVCSLVLCWFEWAVASVCVPPSLFSPPQFLASVRVSPFLCWPPPVACVRPCVPSVAVQTNTRQVTHGRKQQPRVSVTSVRVCPLVLCWFEWAVTSVRVSPALCWPTPVACVRPCAPFLVLANPSCLRPSVRPLRGRPNQPELLASVCVSPL